MSKKFLVVVLVVAIIAVVLLLVNKKQGTISQTNVATSSAIIFRDKTVSEKDAKDTYEIDASYPVVSGLANIKVVNNINAALLAYISQAVSDFKTNNVGGNPDVPAGVGPSTLSIEYSTSTLSSANILSVQFDSEFYSVGAAHPGHQSDTFVFNIVTGKIIALADLFTGNYLQVLSGYSRKALTDQLTEALQSAPDMDMINAGTDPSDPDNFKTFFPDSDGLHIVFNEYQVGPYVIGRQEVVVPYSVLNEVINPKGELASFKK